MRSGRRASLRSALARLAIAAGLSVVLPAAPAGGEEIAFDGWIELTSANLTLITNVDAEIAAGLLRSMEAMRTTVVDVIASRRAKATLPTTVIVFADEASYAPFRLVEREGQFFPTSFENLVLVNGASDRRPLALAASHEYMHALVAEGGQSLPLWLHEGLAEYYSSFHLEGGRAVVGSTVPGHRARLRNRAFLSFVELTEVNDRSVEYHGEDAGRFYAQSWLTVHYLMSDAQRTRSLMALVEAVEGGVALESAYRDAFGSSPEALNGELRRYLNQPTLPSFVLPYQPERTPTRPQAGVLGASEVAYVLGVVALEQARWSGLPERFTLSRQLFDTAIALAPTDGDAHAGLARLEDALGRWGPAEQSFEKAVYLDALEARSYAHYAEFLIRRAAAKGVEPPDTQEQTVRLLERALSIQPRHWRLRAQLGRLSNEVDSASQSGHGQSPNLP